MRPIDKANAQRYEWGAECLGWHLVQSDVLSVIEEMMPPDTSEECHFHLRARQFFRVLSGELVMDVDGARHTLTSGNGIEIAPGVVHQAINASNENVEFLVIFSPPSHGDRVNAA